jgi:hypothetical protein
MTINYKGFARTIIQKAFEGHDWDGGAIQELAVQYEILKEVSYDPKIHGPNDFDVEVGDPWFVFVGRD